MPNIKSAIKRMRSDEKKSVRNNTLVTELKTLNKKLLSLSKSPKEAQEVAARLISRYDSAVNKGAVPRARADRKKSRITAFVTKLSKKKK